MGEEKYLADLSEGERGIVLGSFNEPHMKRRLYDLGFVPGSEIECVLTAPLGDPKAYRVKNALIALRCEDAEKVKIKKRNKTKMGE